MSKLLYQTIFRLVGARGWYRQTVLEDRLTNIRPQIRADLVQLLTSADRNNPFFEGRFRSFLERTAEMDDDSFFAEYAQLPAMTKQDYAQAGMQVMARPWSECDPAEKELSVLGRKRFGSTRSAFHVGFGRFSESGV